MVFSPLRRSQRHMVHAAVDPRLHRGRDPGIGDPRFDAVVLDKYGLDPTRRSQRQMMLKSMQSDEQAMPNDANPMSRHRHAFHTIAPDPRLGQVEPPRLGPGETARPIAPDLRLGQVETPRLGPVETVETVTSPPVIAGNEAVIDVVKTASNEAREDLEKVRNELVKEVREVDEKAVTRGAEISAMAEDLRVLKAAVSSVASTLKQRQTEEEQANTATVKGQAEAEQIPALVAELNAQMKYLRSFAASVREPHAQRQPEDIAKIGTLENEIESLRAKQKSQGILKITSLESEIESLRSAATHDWETFKKQRSDDNAKIVELEIEIESLQRSVANDRGKRQSEDQIKINELEMEIESLQNTATCERHAYTKQQVEHRAQIAELDSQLESLRSTAARDREKQQSDLKTITELETQIESLRSQRDAYAKQQLEEQQSDEKSKVTQLEHEMESLRSIAFSTTHDRDEYKARVAFLEGEIESLRSKSASDLEAYRKQDIAKLAELEGHIRENQMVFQQKELENVGNLLRSYLEPFNQKLDRFCGYINEMTVSQRKELENVDHLFRSCLEPFTLKLDQSCNDITEIMASQQKQLEVFRVEQLESKSGDIASIKDAISLIQKQAKDIAVVVGDNDISEVSKNVKDVKGDITSIKDAISLIRKQAKDHTHQFDRLQQRHDELSNALMKAMEGSKANDLSEVLKQLEALEDELLGLMTANGAGCTGGDLQNINDAIASVHKTLEDRKDGMGTSLDGFSKKVDESKEENSQNLQDFFNKLREENGLQFDRLEDAMNRKVDDAIGTIVNGALKRQMNDLGVHFDKVHESILKGKVDLDLSPFMRALEMLKADSQSLKLHPYRDFGVDEKLAQLHERRLGSNTACLEFTRQGSSPEKALRQVERLEMGVRRRSCGRQGYR